MCKDFTPFHKLGQIIRDSPYPFCACWLTVLIVGIALAPIRMRKTTDVIDTWLPRDGQARGAKEFIQDAWKLQAWTTTQDGLEDQLDRLDIKQNEDFFFRSKRTYYVMWAADKDWDYAEGSSGASIRTKNHWVEWYNFNKQLWELEVDINGQSVPYTDVCETTFATNAFHVSEGLMNSATSQALDPLGLAASGIFLEAGFGPGKYDAILAQLGLPGADGMGGRLWDTIALMYPDDDANPVGKAHQDYHATFTIANTDATLRALLAVPAVAGGPELSACAGDWEENCIRQPLTSGAMAQHNYNYNCKQYILNLSATAGALFNLPLTPNELTFLCANVFMYSSIPGSSEFENTCAPGDITFCIQDSVTEFYGSLFKEPFVGTIYEAYPQLWTEAVFQDSNVDDEAFFAQLDGTCATNGFLVSNNYRYIRSSKYIAEPAKIARRLQIKAGNCTFQHPDSELIARMYEEMAMQNGLISQAEVGYKSALDNVNACVNWEAATTYDQSITGLEQAKLGDPGNAAVYQAQIDGFKVALSDLGLDYDDSNYSTELSDLEDSCNQALAADPLLATSSATVTNVATSVGGGAGLFFTWYKFSLNWDCPDFTDHNIEEAMSYRNKLTNRMTEIMDEFNENSKYLRGCVLSNERGAESYDNLFSQNLIIACVAIFLFITICTLLHFKVAPVAFCGVILILLCIVANFGYMPPPYTPSTFQFLPYLCLGIGVDDLFVVLHHYYDEDNIPKTIHHAGSVITMTSCVNLFIFIALYLISNVPDFSIFTIAATIAIALLYCNVLFGVIPLLAIWERWTGKDQDVNRPGDAFETTDDNHKNKHAYSAHVLASHGSKAAHNYVAYSKALDPFKCIGTPIAFISIFITCTVLAFLKIEGHGFEKIDFGLQLSELVYRDNNDHSFRAITILERFPLFGLDCGAGKKWDSSDPMGTLFDDIAPEFIEFFTKFNGSRPDGVKDASFNPTSWVARLSDDGPQPYPYYTDQARTYPNFPSSWNFWYDLDEAAWTNMTFPEGTIYLRPPVDSSGTGIVPGRDITDMIRNVYDHLDDYKDIGAYCTANILEVYERYLDVEDTLNMGFICAAVIVFVVGMLIIQDPGAVIILTLVDLVTAYQLWGFYGFATLRINSFLTMCIMLGAAFTVQFTAHVNRRFVLSKAPSRWYRVIDALSTYAGPIMWGGATTALAVSAAAFMPAKYFRLYFFYSFIIMVGFGLLNGLAVQSSLLVLIPINFETAGIPMFGEDDAPQRRYSASEDNMDLKQAQVELGITDCTNFNYEFQE